MNCTIFSKSSLKEHYNTLKKWPQILQYRDWAIPSEYCRAAFVVFIKKFFKCVSHGSTSPFFYMV